KSCPQRQVGNCSPQPGQQLLRLRSVDAALHALEHTIVDVLQWHVQIRQDFRRLGQRLDQFVGEVDGIGVEDANPLQPVDVVQLAQQLGEADAAVEIESVICRVLG